MTAWEELVGNSSLDEGTAWDHLLAQEGGGVGNTVYVEIADANIVNEIQGAVIEIAVIESHLIDDILQSNINDEATSISLQSVTLASESAELELELSLSE